MAISLSEIEAAFISSVDGSTSVNAGHGAKLNIIYKRSFTHYKDLNVKSRS